MTESDWKKFKIIRDNALQALCESILADTKNIIDNDSKDFHSRYLDLYELVRKKDKKISQVFDGLSRSKATIQLMQLRAMGLVSEPELIELTTEFEEQTRPL
ncbi:MAG: hypothetical protein O7D86_04565 [Proteobacteria bacterium]|nr:hypothetical protein [Pseudomonadota bacterium]